MSWQAGGRRAATGKVHHRPRRTCAVPYALRRVDAQASKASRGAFCGRDVDERVSAAGISRFGHTHWSTVRLPRSPLTTASWTNSLWSSAGSWCAWDAANRHASSSKRRPPISILTRGRRNLNLGAPWERRAVNKVNLNPSTSDERRRHGVAAFWFWREGASAGLHRRRHLSPSSACQPLKSFPTCYIIASVALPSLSRPPPPQSAKLLLQLPPQRFAWQGSPQAAPGRQPH